MRKPRKGDLLLYAGELWRVKKTPIKGELLECEYNESKKGKYMFPMPLIPGIDDYVLLSTGTYYSRF